MSISVRFPQPWIITPNSTLVTTVPCTPIKRGSVGRSVPVHLQLSGVE